MQHLFICYLWLLQSVSIHFFSSPPQALPASVVHFSQPLPWSDDVSPLQTIAGCQMIPPLFAPPCYNAHGSIEDGIWERQTRCGKKRKESYRWRNINDICMCFREFCKSRWGWNYCRQAGFWITRVETIVTSMSILDQWYIYVTLTQMGRLDWETYAMNSVETRRVLNLYLSPCQNWHRQDLESLAVRLEP